MIATAIVSKISHNQTSVKEFLDHVDAMGGMANANHDLFLLKEDMPEVTNL
jgi:hypothetical protein